MPEMDGFEATRRIRQLDLPYRVSILALTANAMQGDKEQCLQAGMDDYLVKPIEMKFLADALRRWSNQPKRAGDELQTGGAH